jgi:hypothetical protein
MFTNVTAVPIAKGTLLLAGIVNVRAFASVDGCRMCLPASAATSVYAVLWLFWGMFRKPTELVPSTVQLLKVPEAGVPSTGAVNVLLVSVCEVFVLATSVKVLLPNAIVLLVTVFVLVAVSTLVGVMTLDSTAMMAP